jgi:hypothetical protein
VVRVKAILTMLLATIVVVSSITIFSCGVTAQDSDDSDVSADPYIIIFSGDHPIDYLDATPSIHTDKGNATIRLKIGMPIVDSMFIIGETVTSVSYKASWQNNKNVTLFNGASGKDLFFDLDGIPYGNHHIEVSASGHVTFVSYDFSSSRLIYGSSTKYLNFTVAPNPTPTTEPTPTPYQGHQATEQEIILGIAVTIAVIAAGLGLLIYLIKRKKIH